jgi:carboxyl-terminal processing protease
VAGARGDPVKTRAGLALSGLCALGLVAATSSPYEGLDLFARVLTQVQDGWVDESDQRDLVYGALGGLVGRLDRNSRFYPPDVWRKLQQDANGVYVGVGIQTASAPCGLRVIGLVRDGPAERGGVRVDDCITAADGRSLAGMDGEEAGVLVRGTEGTVVSLALRRGEASVDVALLRRRVVEPDVEAAWLAPGVAWLRIVHFRYRTGDALGQAVSDLRSTPRAAVLDLRSNPGGRMDAAVAVADRFLSGGRVVSTRGRAPGSDEDHDATASPGDWAWPLVVLIDGETASAAEIVAGALRDHHRATLIGTRSYGKGSVQTVHEYEDGSALRLTIARYYLPSGASIDGVGIAPDREVTGEARWTGTPAERLRSDPALAAALEALTGP